MYLLVTAMSRVSFTQNIQRHVSAQVVNASGATVREVLEQVFTANPRVRDYVLDDQGELRKHMVVFIDGVMVRDRTGLTDAVGPDSDVYVMQALSGG